MLNHHLNESVCVEIFAERKEMILCSDIVRGTNYLLESLGIERRIRSVNEFASPVLIPIYENICSCRLNGLNRISSPKKLLLILIF